MQPEARHQPTRPRRALMPLLAAVLAVFALSACSNLQIAYSFADNVLAGRADDYLDLDDQQKELMHEQTGALIAWHRQSMLPKYAVFFRDQADIAEAGGWTREQMSAAFSRFRGLLDETVKGASPFIATVLVDQTTEEKIAYLEARMAENSAERRADAEAETAADAADERVERRVDRFSRFMGDLTEAQIAIVRRYTDDGLDNSLRWLDHREKLQSAFAAFLRTEPTREDLARFVHQILVRSHEFVEPDYQAISEARWALFENMYFDVLSTLSDEQRDTLVFTLRDYADDMLSLAGV